MKTKIAGSKKDINLSLVTDIEKKKTLPFKNLLKHKKMFVLFLSLLIVIGLGYVGSKWVIVAWVDNMPITRFELYSQLDKRFGEETKDQLITEKLVLSEASKKGFTVSSSEIETEYKKIQDQVGDNQKLKSLLSAQKMTEDDLRKQLYLQLLMRKTFGKDISVTDDEVNKYFEDNKDKLFSKDSTQKLDDKLKEQIREQLKQQKISQNFLTFLDNAKKGTRVIRN